MSTNRPERGVYTDTGWRIVGRAADAIVERVIARAAERIEPGPAKHTLYAVRFTVPNRLDGRASVEQLLDAIGEDIRRTWSDCPRLKRDEEVVQAPSRFGGLRFQHRLTPGKEWIGEIVWRTVHPFVPGAPVTTWVLIEEQPTFTRVNVRVVADDGVTSVRGPVGAGQAQPAFIRALRRLGLTPTWLGGVLEARRLGPADVPDLVHNTLPSPERDYPIVLLSPLENGQYVVPPDEFAWELLGRGKLYVLREHRQTFELSDEVGGKRMSCFWGAARAYMPGWSLHDDPFAHPLLIGGRLADPVMRAAWLGELGIWLGTSTQLAPPLDEWPTEEPAPAGAADATSREEFHPVGSGTGAASEGSAGGDAPPAAVTSPGVAVGATSVTVSDLPVEARHGPTDGATGPASGAGDGRETADGAAVVVRDPRIDALVADVQNVGNLMGRMTDQIERMIDEIERLRTILSVRSSSTGAIERRLARLEDILEEVFPDGRDVGRHTPSAAAEGEAHEAEREDEGRESLVDVIREAAESHPDALEFLDSAYEAARESPYEDPERLRAVLKAMARIARRRRDGLLGTSLREAFRDLGIDYRGAIARTTSAKLRQQYRFTYGDETIEAEEHIVLGNTYDPRRCLRIYFSSRVVSDPRFIMPTWGGTSRSSRRPERGRPGTLLALSGDVGPPVREPSSWRKPGRARRTRVRAGTASESPARTAV